MATRWDFRSDTVTRPTPEMLAAMAEAPLGDDVFGDDPTVAKLEKEAAAMLGKEAALFCVSGTLSNQLALRTHVGALQEVLCDHRAHIHVWEVGGIHTFGASVAPVVPTQPPGSEAVGDFLSAHDVRVHTRLDNALYHQPTTTLLALENTLNGEPAARDHPRPLRSRARCSRHACDACDACDARPPRVMVTSRRRCGDAAEE